MKKQTIAIIVSIMMVIVLAGFLIADVLSRTNSDITISKDSKTTLTAKGITAPETTELICEDYKCSFKMYQEIEGEIYNLGTHYLKERYCESWSECEEEPCESECLSYHTYTNAELLEMKNSKIKEWLENYADVLDKRNAETKTEKLGGGTITIKEKAGK